MDNFWRNYWSEYGPVEATSEDDLFKQVAHTVNRQPIPREIVAQMLKHIVGLLKLEPPDHLLDFCCGNGLFSYELATHVSQVTGIDFVERNIRTAQLQKPRSNICYVVGDATAPLVGIVGSGSLPNKFLMHYSLAYFTQNQLSTILSNISRLLGIRAFQFLLTGIPNIDLKWNYYNTPERRERHLENELRKENFNDGLGRWWQADEIRQVCSQHGLRVVIQEQPTELSNYRMDAVISFANAGK